MARTKWCQLCIVASFVPAGAACGDESSHADGSDETGVGESGEQEGTGLGEETGNDDSMDATSAEGSTDESTGFEPDLPDDACAEAYPCGEDCCGEGEFCLSGTCVVPGSPCWDSGDCAEGEYCELEAGDAAPPPDGCHAPPRDQGACLPRPPLCEDGQSPTEGCVVACVAHPFLDATPLETHTWSSFDVMNLPIVVQLDDDDCDGTVDQADIPDIVFPAFDGLDNWKDDGFLVALSIIDGKLVEKWITVLDQDQLRPSYPIAAGDLDQKPGAEIVACSETEKIRVFASDGTELWTSDLDGVCGVPNIADLDQDGSPEIVTQSFAWDGITGEIVATFGGVEAETGHVVPVDLNGDGTLEVVAADRVYAFDGTVLLDTGLFAQNLAVADFDLDGRPEVAAVSTDFETDRHHFHVWTYDEEQVNGYEMVRQDIDLHQGLDPSKCKVPQGGGGSPIIADLNGDDLVDVAVGSRVSFVAFDGKKLLDPNVGPEETTLWVRPQDDCSSGGVGAGIFDLDGDGVPEMAHADELTFGVYDAATGDPFFQTCNTNGTAGEFPLVADADGDGAAEILVAANNYYSPLKCEDDSTRQGLRIFEASLGQWMPTTSFWNEYNYHQTNVDEDGTIPAPEPMHWENATTNSFRRSPQIAVEFLASDLLPTAVTAECGGPYTLVATVWNHGQAAAPAGVEVAFFMGDPEQGGTWLGTLPTGEALLPGTSLVVPLQIANPPEALLKGNVHAFVVVDAEQAHLWRECDRTNNVTSGDASCE